MTEPGSAAMERVVEEIAKKIARRRMLDGPPSLAMYPVERFEEAFERVWTGTADLDERQRQNYRADAKIAAAYIESLTRERDEAREALKVKALIWKDVTTPETSPRWSAESVLGEYLLIFNLRDGEWWSPRLGGLSVYWNSLNEAQTAAQADFETKILAALKPEEPTT